MTIFNCDYQNRCINSEKCLRCSNFQFLKLPEDIEREIAQKKAKNKRTDYSKDSKKSWNNMEQEVANNLNAIPTTKQYMSAHRQPRSGAISGLEGDIIDDILLIECKERASEVSGKKSITIKKDWLDKIDKEAKSNGKTPCFCFRYKDDSEIYAIINYKEITNLITNYKYLLAEVDRLRKE